MTEDQPIELATATTDAELPAAKNRREEVPAPKESPAEAPPKEAVRSETQPEPQQQDPRRRLRELLAIPDHKRTDAIWDEIIELEICLAPGNRIQGNQAEPGRRQGSGQGMGHGQGQGRRPDQQRRQDQPPGTKPAKRFFKKPKRPSGAPPKT